MTAFAGDAPGLRIGMLTPSSNTCLEPTTYRMVIDASAPASVHFARVSVTSVSLDRAASAQFETDRMVAAARLLAEAKVQVIAWNGTAGSWLGIDHDRGMCRAIEESTGIPATTSTLALLDACRVYGVRRLGLVVPYTREVADRIVATYADEGVEVTEVQAAGITDNEAFGRISPTAISALIEQAAASGAQAVAVVCTNMHGALVAAACEEKLGLPVLDSVAATLWKTFDVAGVAVRVPGWGTLMDSGALRAQLQGTVEDLLEATSADRATLRLDLPDSGFTVDLPVAEAAGPGMSSLRGDSTLDQRRLATVEWLERHRRPLVQPDFRGDPRPPTALVDRYGVHAQMLGPVLREGHLTGWLSVHSSTEREWTDSDQGALAQATRDVQAALDRQ